MLLSCPECGYVVEILGATEDLHFRCLPCDVALERCEPANDDLARFKVTSVVVETRAR